MKTPGTSMWRPGNILADDFFVVLPAREDFKDSCRTTKDL